MKIVCCVKQVLDPEIPADAYRVAADGRSPEIRGVPEARVIDTFAERALEAGARLRDASEGELTALTVGGEEMEEALRRAYALTADRAVRVRGPSWEGGGAEPDGVTVAVLLARAVEALGGADVILCGREAADIEEGVVGPAVAEELGIPCVTVGRRLELDGDRIRVERATGGVVEVVAARLPVVVTVAPSEGNTPRMPTSRDRMLARGKKIRVLGPDDLSGDPDAGPGSRLRRLEKPPARGGCERIDGEDGGAIARTLLERLADEGVL